MGIKGTCLSLTNRWYTISEHVIATGVAISLLLLSVACLLQVLRSVTFVFMSGLVVVTSDHRIDQFGRTKSLDATCEHSL